MSTIIEVGTKLISIDDEWMDGNFTVSGPRCGDVVTVRKIAVYYAGGEFEPIAWFDEFSGDTFDDGFFIGRGGFVLGIND